MNLGEGTVGELIEELSQYPPDWKVYDIDGMSIVPPPEDVVIHAPPATAASLAPMHGTEPNMEEAGDGLD